MEFIFSLLVLCCLGLCSVVGIIFFVLWVILKNVTLRTLFLAGEYGKLLSKHSWTLFKREISKIWRKLIGKKSKTQAGKTKEKVEDAEFREIN